jgi:hypothetical protein
MPEHFANLIRQFEGAIIRAWVDAVYGERRVELAQRLSYGQLIDHLPEALEELARLLDNEADDIEIGEAARHFRSHAQIRFQQGVLIDEVARELMLLRQAINDFLWREGINAAHGDLWDVRDAIRRANRFVDELLSQAVVVYAASLRPPVETRTSVWPPPRRRKTDFTEGRDK